MSKEEPLPKRPRSSVAIILVAVGVIGASLYLARSAFIPVALGVLFALLLSSPVEALHRYGFPRSASALLILAIFLGILTAAVDLLWEPAQAWLAAAPHASVTIQRKLSPVARIMRRIDVATNRAGHLTETAAIQDSAVPKPVATATETKSFIAETRAALIATATLIILTLFLLSAGPPILARMSASFANNVQATHILQVFEAVRSEVGRYYRTIALINVGLGVATFGVMWALGMPNPVLCGVLAGALNFIPYVGSATTLLILTVVAFVSFDGVGRVLAVAGSYIALATIEGQVVQPLFVGQRLKLSPVIVFLALWFAGWFWGVAGIVLAIPSLVALKVAAEHSEHGASLVEFLSPRERKRGPRRRAPVDIAPAQAERAA